MQLSIITVNLNNRDGLRKTAESVVSQTYKDYEWIVIDGGSTDGSRELIEQYAEHISYWVSEPDKGIYNAMNKGILKAQGEYCLFLNSGDYFTDGNSLQKAFDLDFTEDVVYGYSKFDRGDHFEIKASPKEITLRTFVESTIHHTGNVFIRRELFNEDKYGLYDETLKIVSDWKWFLQALGLSTATARYIDEMMSVFDCTGISETQRDLLHEEREMVLKEVIKERILLDYMKFSNFEDALFEQEKKIRGSLSYKIGSFVLAPFRYIKNFLRRFQ